MDLRKILDDHKRWLNKVPTGIKAELHGADLRNADLMDANLRNADLMGADLRNAELVGADLRGINLRRANLGGADLRYAKLHSADLRYANLNGADLRRGDLRHTNLGFADLRNANLDMVYPPLSCRGLGWIIDRRIMAQLAYHWCSMMCDDPEVQALQDLLMPLANEMHRTDVPRLMRRVD